MTSQASGGQLGAILRAQAEALRGQPGAQAQVDMYLRAAEQAEAQAAPVIPPRVQQNLDKHLQGPQPHSATDQP